MNKYPLVSVIIPTRNSEKHLKYTLSAIKNQTYSNVEIIIVDNNSFDKTKEIAKKFTKKVYNFGPERTFQINFGVEKAKGKYIYYTGGDLVPTKDLIKEAVEQSEKKGFDAIYLNVVTNLKKPNFWQKARAIERKCYFKEPGMSAARFYKRKVFLEIGGLDENLGPIDDLEFQHRLDIKNYKTGIINAYENNIGEYSKLYTIITRSLYYGWFIKKYADKYPVKTKKQYRLIRSELINHKRELLEDKVTLFAFILYKFFQYIFGGIGYVLAKISNDSLRIEKFLYNLNY